MKNVIFCFLLCIGFQMMKAQSFQDTQKYIFETEVKENRVEKKNSLRSWGGTTEDKKTFNIKNFEIFEDIFINTLEFPNNNGTSEVLKMTLEILLTIRNNRFVYYLSQQPSFSTSLLHNYNDLEIS